VDKSTQRVQYSRGSSKFDNNPRQLISGTFDEFEISVLEDRSVEKGMAYVCAGLASGLHYQDPDRFVGHGNWRLKDHVLERVFLPFDCDWFSSPEVFKSLLNYSLRYRGFAYTTASHTDSAPRARLVFSSSRPVNRDECILVCKAIQAQMLAELGRDTIKFDESVYRGEQPLYTPVLKSQTYHFDGLQVDVDSLLTTTKGSIPLQRSDKEGAALLDALYTEVGFEAPETVSDGQGRESTILRYAGSLRSQGLSEHSVLQVCLDYNQLHILPPLDREIVLDRVKRYAQQEHSLTRQEPDWTNPVEPGDGLPPVPTFNPDILPSGFRGWITDIAERMQCPIEFLAVGAMVAAGSALGNRIGIQPKQHDTGWIEVPNLWGAIVGRPGVMKTPALAEVLAPLHKIEVALQEAFPAARAQYELDRLVYEATKRTITAEITKSGAPPNRTLPPEPEPPQPQRAIVCDSTYQKLGQILCANPSGLLVFQDELSGLLKRLDTEGQEAARAFYLEAWNGKNSYTFDRIDRGTLRIPRLCISILGGLQPTKLNEYLRAALLGGAGDDGLAQRFQLLVYPDVKGEWKQVDRPPKLDEAAHAESVFLRLAKLEPLNLGAIKHYEGGIPVLKFDKDAQAKFNKWRSLLENDLRKATRHPALESHLGKYRKMVPALALLHHLIDGESGDVGVASLDCALKWHLFLFAHAERCYSGGSIRNNAGARLLLHRIKASELQDGFTVRDLYRKGWSLLATPKEAADAAELLCDLGWLRGAKDDRKDRAEGRLTTRYLLHPILKQNTCGGSVSTPTPIASEPALL
jgi:hypothetical protein